MGNVSTDDFWKRPPGEEPVGPVEGDPETDAFEPEDPWIGEPTSEMTLEDNFTEGLFPASLGVAGPPAGDPSATAGVPAGAEVPRGPGRGDAGHGEPVDAAAAASGDAGDPPEVGDERGASDAASSDARSTPPAPRASAIEREARAAASEVDDRAAAGASEDDEAEPEASDAVDEAVAAEEEAPEVPVVRTPPGRLQRLSGTIAVTALLVVGTLFAVWIAVQPPPPPAPVPPPTPTPVAIPSEARTKIYRSPMVGTGEFRVASLTIAPATPAKATNTYAVRVEDGANVDANEAATFIQKVLDDPRGWAGFGNNNFSLVPDAETAKLVITIATPDTADKLCGAPTKTQGLYSCRVKNAIVINSDRWHFMTPTYNNVEEYRAYAVNHFVGQFLGQRIAFCAKKGTPAPAMAQQDTNLDGCLPNAWPKLP